MNLFLNNNPWYLNGVTGAIIPEDRFMTHAQLVSRDNRLRPVEYGYDIHNAKGKVAYNTVDITEKAFVAGFELEVQPSDIKTIYDLHHGLAFKSNWLFLRRDKTLNYGGVEFVSIPLPIDYLRYREMFNFTDSLKEMGIKTDDKNGFHIHVDHNYLTSFRTDDNDNPIPMQLAALELHHLYYLLSDKFLTALFGRKCNSFCRSLKHEVDSHHITLISDWAKRFGKHQAWPSCYHVYPKGEHYAEINFAGMGNPETFEFRRGAATLDGDKLYAMMDFVYMICQYIRYNNVFFNGPEKSYRKFTQKLKTKSHSALLRRLAEQYL